MTDLYYRIIRMPLEKNQALTRQIGQFEESVFFGLARLLMSNSIDEVHIFA